MSAGISDGRADIAEFYSPYGVAVPPVERSDFVVAVDVNGNEEAPEFSWKNKPEMLTTEMIVADTGNSRIRRIVAETCDKTGSPAVTCGGHGTCGFDGWCLCGEYKAPNCGVPCPGKWKYKYADLLPDEIWKRNMTQCNGGQCYYESYTSSAKCECNRGYRGDDCTQTCPLDQAGVLCGGGGYCNVNGTCECAPGWDLNRVFVRNTKSGGEAVEICTIGDSLKNKWISFSKYSAAHRNARFGNSMLQWACFTLVFVMTLSGADIDTH